MDLKINSYNKKITPLGYGEIFVQYHNLELRCYLSYYTPSKKWYIRLPCECYRKNGYFFFKKVAFFTSKEESDEFQKKVLALMIEHHPEEIVANPPPLPPLVKKLTPFVQKARSVSKFAIKK